MKDNDLRSFMRDISDDLVKEAEMLAPGAAVSDGNGSTARGRDSSPDSRRWKILEIAAVAVVTVALATFAIYFAVDKTRRIAEPTVTPILTGSAGLPSDEPVETPTTVPTDEPAETPAAGPTDTPTDEPTEIPTETPTQEIISAEPMFTAPPASKMYEFSTNNELAAALSLKTSVFYEMLREDNKNEYGGQYARFLQLFSDGSISFLAPRRFGEAVFYSAGYRRNDNGEYSAPIELITNGQFNLPWIRLYCYSSYQNRGKLLAMEITYPELIGESAAGKNVEGVIAALDPTYPLPGNFSRDSDRAKETGFVSVKKRNLNTRSKDKIESIVYTEENGSLRYVFLMNGCLVSVRARTESDPGEQAGYTTSFWADPKMAEDELLYYLSLEPFEIIENALPQKPEMAKERSTDPSRITLDEARQLIRDAIVIERSVGSGGETFQWFRLGNSFNRFTSQFDLSVSDGVTYPGTYRQVFDGFDEAGVRELINKTFVPSVAAIYNSNDTFFNKYYVAEDGKTYFCRWYYAEEDGATYYDSSFDVEGLDTLVLDEKKGIGVMRKRGKNDGEAMVYVKFAWDGGQWKLASINSPDLALSEYSSGFTAYEFSEDNALRVIRTVLADLYSLTHTDGSGLNVPTIIPVPDEGVPEYAYRGVKKYQLAAGVFSDPKMLSGYASRYLTQPLVDRMLNGGQCVLISDGHVYWREGYSYFEEYFGMAFIWSDSDVKFEIVEQSATTAKVRLSGLRFKSRGMNKYETYDYNNLSDDLEFEFELIDGVWKISGGNFFDLLDAVYNDPATEPYPTAAAPADVPPAPTYPDLKTNWSSFFSGMSISCITTYKEVHLKPGESMKIPVIWTSKKGINPEGYSLSVDFETSDAVKFTVLDGSEAPDCAFCFVASAISAGKAEVHVYGTYDVDNISNESIRSMLMQQGHIFNGVLIDVMLTVYVD